MSTTTNNQNFFNTTKKGEIHEWKEMLNNEKEATRKDAVKKVIAAMTVGKDVSTLFPEVIKSIQTNNIELKKLVYLYVMNYAKSNPDLAMMAVNTFVQDSKHENPLVRALAVRTMGCIRVNKIIDYLAEPLQRTLSDKDPYVRKTAAVAVAKLFDLNPELTIEKGFIDDLQKLLSDANPMVIANAVASLSEIQEYSKDKIVDFNQKIINTLLSALGECTEWGQIYILDAIVQYDPDTEKEAIQIAERVVPRLAHANSAVILSAVKIIMRMMNKIKDAEVNKVFSKKLTAPLVTLLNSKPEIQYVALRNISLVVQKRPTILAKDFKVFFCKYNDPIYVKLEKLDILVQLASERNIETILLEFQEYSSEVDIQFVRRSVRAIGRCAIKLDRAAQKCIDVLLELIKTKINYVVQEAIIVIKDIFRKYPNKYEGIIGTLCENLDTLDEPEAKASMIWIIGEYGERIENADELLDVFADTFHDESPLVQLQLLTACVKLFLKRPNVAETLVTRVLTLATKESDNPDLRDRGYVYYRLLSVGGKTAEEIVLGEKPVIRDDATDLSTQLLNELLNNIASLSSVYHKPAELFVPDFKKKDAKKNLEDDEEREDDEAAGTPSTPSDMIGGSLEGQKKVQQAPVTMDSLLDFGGSSSTQTTTQTTSSVSGGVNFDDLFGPGPSQKVEEVVSTPSIKYNTLLTSDKGKGLQVEGVVTRVKGSIVYHLKFTNYTQTALNGFAVKFNKNAFGFAPAGPLNVPDINPNSFFETQLQLVPKGQQAFGTSNALQTALKVNQLGVLYFQDFVDLSTTFEETGQVERNEFLALWKSIPDEQEHTVAIQAATVDPDSIIQKLSVHNIFFIAKHVTQQQSNLYFSAQLTIPGSKITMLCEVGIPPNSKTIQLSTKTAEIGFTPLFEKNLQKLLE
jgi:AP-1 complex subunit beta-1